MSTEKTHSEYSPSQLKRIIECPGSVQLCREEPEQEESVYAAEGTMLHEVTAKHIEEQYTELDYRVLKNYDLSDDQLLCVQDCLHYLRDRVENYRLMGFDVEVLVEQEVSLKKFGLPKVEGTADIIINIYETSSCVDCKNGRDLVFVVVIDWKFGSGVIVESEGNPQLLAYGLGAVGSYNTLEGLEGGIIVHVFQPKRDHASSTSYTKHEAEKWLNETLSVAVAESRMIPPKLNPGIEQCRWCSVKYKCTALYESANDTAKEVFSAFNEDKQVSISIEKLAELLKKTPQLISYVSGLETYAHSLLMKGEEVPGFKLVEGRSNRKWVDESTVFDLLTSFGLPPEECCVTKVISPTQAEKKLGKAHKNDERFVNAVEKPQGKPVIVPLEDKREPYRDDLARIFKVS